MPRERTVNVAPIHHESRLATDGTSRSVPTGSVAGGGWDKQDCSSLLGRLLGAAWPRPSYTLRAVRGELDY